MTRPSKLTSLFFIDVTSYYVWRHTDRQFSVVSESVCWYWQYPSMKTKGICINWRSILKTCIIPTIYRIMSVLNVETDTIASITASLTGWPVIMYVSKSYRMTCDTSDNVCLQKWWYCFHLWRQIKMCLTPHWPIHIIYCLGIVQL
jgi:hypothetical protein